MARITRPNDITTQGRAGISTANLGTGAEAIGSAAVSAGRATQAAANQGQLASQIGQLAEREGRQYFEESRRAHEMGVTSNAVSEATLEFQKAKQERMANSVDKDGNPTFTTLVDDLGSIGRDIGNRVSNRITSPEAAAKFNANFNSFVSNQQVSALKVARTQQIEFARTSLDKGLGSLVTQASADETEHLGTYATQGRQMLDDAMVGGVISPEDHTRLASQFQETMMIENVNNTISTNPAKAQEILQRSAGELGVSEGAKQQLDKTLDAKVRSDEIQAVKAKQQATIDNNNRTAAIVTDAEQRIETDNIREDELLKLESSIPEASFKQLKNKFVKETKAKQNQNLKFISMSGDIAAGNGASDYTTSDIDKHYKFLTDAYSSKVGRPASLSEKAQLVAGHKTPVRAFAKEMESSLRSGNVDAAVDALRAYTYVRDRNLPSLDGNKFTNETESMVTYAETLVDRGGLDPKDAVLKAREDVFNVNKEVKSVRQSQYRAISDFKAANIENTVADELGAEGFFGRNKKVSGDAIATYREFTRQAFISTGDEEAAKKTAKNMMSRTYGLSTVVGPEEEFVFAPPEKFFPNIDPAELRNQLVTEVTPLLPEGTEAGAISLKADDATIGQSRPVRLSDGSIVMKAAPSYVVQRTVPLGDGSSITVPLTDPNTGNIVRWAPDADLIQKQKQEAGLEEAKQKREQFLKDQEQPQFPKGPGLI